MPQPPPAIADDPLESYRADIHIGLEMLLKDVAMAMAARENHQSEPRN